MLRWVFFIVFAVKTNPFRDTENWLNLVVKTLVCFEWLSQRASHQDVKAEILSQTLDSPQIFPCPHHKTLVASVARQSASRANWSIQPTQRSHLFPLFNPRYRSRLFPRKKTQFASKSSFIWNKKSEGNVAGKLPSTLAPSKVCHYCRHHSICHHIRRIEEHSSSSPAYHIVRPP